MKITKLNFKYLYPKISKILSECDYIAIDLEFSGTASKKELTNSKYDDVNLRYFKLKESTKNYLPLQFGLCGMKINKNSNSDSQKKIVRLYPMNFYIFPHVHENASRKYFFDIGSINFLSNNMFDFNKTFYDGVRYISLSDFDNKKIQIDLNKRISKKKETKIFPPEAKLFTISIFNQLKKFVENFVKNNLAIESEENLFRIEINFVRKIMLEYFISNVNNLFKIDENKIIFDVEIDETNITKTILKLKITNEKFLEQKLLHLEHEKNFKKIASWIYYQSLAMIESDDESHKIIWNKILTNLVFKNLKSENCELNSVIENFVKERKSNFESFSENSENYIKEIKNILTNSKSKIKFTSPFYKELSKFILDLDNVEETYKVGFTKVISDLIRNKKSLIFHNGILDLIHLIDKFVEPIPETFEEFQNVVNKYFPNIYDTKYIIENNSSLFSIFPQSSLETVYNKISSGEEILNLNTNLKKLLDSYDMEDIEIDEEFAGNDYQLNISKNKNFTKNSENLKILNSAKTEDSISFLDDSILNSNLPKHLSLSNDSIRDEEDSITQFNDSNEGDESFSDNILSIRSHEAGYDAMLTCYVFAFLFKFLSNNNNPFSDKNSILLFEMFKNKMLFSGLQFFCDFNRKKNPKFNTNSNSNTADKGPRFEIFVLLDLPELITVDELKNNFKTSFGMNPIIYKLFGQNVAYAIFTKSREREEFLKLKSQNDESLILAKLYLQEYKKDSPIVSYSKYVSTIKSDLDVEKIFNQLESNEKN